ncbi:serine/threonine protein kinase [Criblamydia sequanensis]|uniref:Serine/threonine protein kinase n=1 Tax=Candidatus Criblamydia sequanensis CRIB-18 TaxID=1437425 RepID=A0A090CXS0_9BACT|nr:serine/threonine-protein kinase [Criblamydia sequanensis]CDR32942.1 putative serine/threonine protein kinase [Criblamydia sequanensis CRIB-18]
MQNEEDEFESFEELNPESLEALPRQIGPYKIESLLQKGGMSILFLATHPESKEPITIKVLSPKYVSNPEAIKRFLYEAEIISMTDHPNIVKLYGYGQWEGGLYIAMEFIEGISLRQLLLRYPISLKQALEYIIDIAYALCHLHTHGVIHRDLKPENILVTDSRIIKVIDFGIAQLISQEEGQIEDNSMRVMGTPIYMSPEQRNNPNSVSYPSDIYSLGIITYELILGKLSHGRIHLSLMPKGMQKILSKALQANPEDRYQDIVDFISDISSYMHSENMQKEGGPSDALRQIATGIHLAENNLVPEAPLWSDIECSYAYHKGTLSKSIFYDFLVLKNKSYGLITIESYESGIEGVIYNSVLRGMVKALYSREEKIEKLTEELNAMLFRERMPHHFQFNFLKLNPIEETLEFLSCGGDDIWILKKDQKEPLKIQSNASELGKVQTAKFEPLIVPWKPGEECLIIKLSSGDDEKSPLETLSIKDYILQNLLESKEKETKEKILLLIHRLKRSVNTRVRKRSIFIGSFTYFSNKKMP